MTNTVLSYPIPAYQNVPIRADYYIPNVFVISAITLGPTTVITTALNHNYVIGQTVRLSIPNKYGSRLLNRQQGLVISIPALDQVELNIDSNSVDPFISTPTYLPFESQTLPQIMAIGDVNSGVINSHGRSPTGTFISGSFIDISPV